MHESKETIAKLLAAFADALNSMDHRDFDLLLQGKAKLRLVEQRGTRKKFLNHSGLDEAVSEIAQKLNSAESREAAGDLIASVKHPRRRNFLVLLSEASGVSVGSKDSIATIERKLIENTVGARLRSQAIKNVAF